MEEKKIHNTAKRSLRAPEFIDRFSKAVKSIDPARRFVRAQQHQELAIENLKILQDYAEEVKKEAALNGHPNDANLILSISCMVSALIEELSLIISLKENRPNDAWDNLISANNRAQAALRAHPVADKLGSNEFIDRMTVYENLLFPEPVFVSPAFEIGERECSNMWRKLRRMWPHKR
jgi:hypothetical protein